MKLKNKILLLTLSLISIVGFTACGDGDSSFLKEDSETIIPISIACVTTPTGDDISSYITLNSGDVIVKDNNGTEVSIYHDVDGVKKVCLLTPSAHIVRGVN